MKLNNKQQKTFNKIFVEPTRSDINWKDIENLITALGGDKSQEKGSRIRFMLNEVKATFHRPHPKPTADKGTVESVRRFLTNSGVN